MTSRKSVPPIPELAASSNKKRKILADLHSGMVLLARFAHQVDDTDAAEEKTSDSRRSNEVRQVLRTPAAPKKHRWN
jgi:hypothetical protein